MDEKKMLVKCLDTNTGDLIVGKVYVAEWIEKVCSNEMYAIKDETGEYYLYPPSWFEILEGDVNKLPR